MKDDVLAALAYFDIFDYPASATELYRFAWKGTRAESFAACVSALDALAVSGAVAHRAGRYAVPGRADTLQTRERAVRHVDKKLLIARRACRTLRFVPCLRAVFVCNTVAAGVAKPESDIDVFIVVRRGRLWLTRLFATGILSLLGLRRHGHHIANRICLSFYVTDDALDLGHLAIPEDAYLAHWVHELIPLFDPDGLYKTIVAANHWTDTSLPRAAQETAATPRIRVDDTRLSHWCRRALERLWGGTYGSLLEQQAKTFQQTKMAHRRQAKETHGNSRVVVTDKIMKFHEEDRREEFRDAWKKRCATLGLFP